MDTLTNESRKARKVHGCYECGRKIQPGEAYRYQFNVDGGDSWTWKACEQCWWLLTSFVFTPDWEPDYDTREGLDEWVRSAGPSKRYDHEAKLYVFTGEADPEWYRRGRILAWSRRRWANGTGGIVSLDFLREIGAQPDA